MSFVTRHAKTLVVGVGCLAVGAGASAIAGAGASTTRASHAARPAVKAARHARLRAQMRRAVHGEFVIHTKTGFATVTFDRGFVQSVSGDAITLREGTKTATYKTVTLTIASSARVRNNGKRSTLSAIKPGERATVRQGRARTFVVARNPK